MKSMNFKDSSSKAIVANEQFFDRVLNDENNNVKVDEGITLSPLFLCVNNKNNVSVYYLSSPESLKLAQGSELDLGTVKPAGLPMNIDKEAFNKRFETLDSSTGTVAMLKRSPSLFLNIDQLPYSLVISNDFEQQSVHSSGYVKGNLSSAGALSSFEHVSSEDFDNKVVLDDYKKPFVKLEVSKEFKHQVANERDNESELSM